MSSTISCSQSNEMVVAGKSADEIFQNKGVVSLIEAVVSKNRLEAEKLVQGGIDVNTKGYDGVTPLLWVQYSQDQDAMALLLDLGADPNRRLDKGGSPLWFAAGKGNKEILLLLLKHGANPNMQIGPHSPLSGAVLEGHLECAELLLKYGADINFHNGDSVIDAAIVHGRYDYVNWALVHGYNYDLKMARRLVSARPEVRQESERTKALQIIDKMLAEQDATNR